MAVEDRQQLLVNRDELLEWPNMAQALLLGFAATAFIKLEVPEYHIAMYVTGSDHHDRIYGLIVAGAMHLGALQLSDLEWGRDTLGLPVTRNESFQPRKLQQIANTEAYRQYAEAKAKAL